MVNSHGQTVCDYTKIIVNDGVTLYPGYVEVKDGMLYRYDSNDPLNELAKIKPYITHNKVRYKYIAKSKPCDNPKLQGKHFLSEKAMNRYLTSLE